MTLSLQQLRSRLSSQFSDLEQIDESVVCFTRRLDDRPFAVCYIDISDDLPSSSESLNVYQDRIIGKRYFHGATSLQWNNYLYFVVDAEKAVAGALQETKYLIERDRKYARKFVIAEEELDSAITPFSLHSAEKQVYSGILTTWINLLAHANLDRAVLNDESLPRRLELIEASYGQDASHVPTASTIRTGSKEPFLATLELQKFRAFPLHRTFDFGKVSLICGANGTGKTSILEAIELAYCGSNKRNPKANEPYRFRVTFADGTSETVTERRPASIFRDRNLAWYGQAEVRTNRLYQSFSQFNFLNTDAAVGLAESTDTFEEDLSRLLVGPETSKTWKEVGRTADKLGDKIKELDAVRNQANLELASVNRQLTASSEQEQESDAIYTRLREIVQRAGWPFPRGGSEKSVAQLIKPLVELDALVKQAVACEWAGSPLTIEKLERYARQTDETCSITEDHIRRLNELIREEDSQVETLAELERMTTDVAKMSRLLSAGVPKKTVDLERIDAAVLNSRRLLEGHSVSDFRELLQGRSDNTVAELLGGVAAERELAREKLKDAEGQYSKFAALRDEAVALSQQLRAIASQLLDGLAPPDICPLCHTEFPSGQLSERIQADVDHEIEGRASRLLRDVSRCNEELDSIHKTESLAKWISRYLEQSQQPPSITVGSVLEAIVETRRQLDALEQDARQRRDELIALHRNGLDIESYRELLPRIVQSVRTTEPLSSETLEQLRIRLEAKEARARSAIETARNAIRDTRELARESLGIRTTDDESHSSVLATMRERIAMANGLLQRLVDYRVSFPWADDMTFSELLIVTTSIRQVAGEFQSALTRERNASRLLTEASSRREQIRKQLAGLSPRIERLCDALDVLLRIQREYSLSGAMEDALRQNRDAIEAIFGRIHSPAEFSGLGDKITTLVRKKDGAAASLQQISTGQRAAFALSIFLAQNALLRVAPPIVLIDDPIAHVDDLNCLSFLDYLRDIVASGERQVVFSTASEKLATLFERKFDFLGEKEFQRFDLRR
jgi:DNA repair protein SbcC/Rad50